MGIGQPIAVQFDENIPDRLAAEAAITVTTNPPVEGAFYWVNNREVRWRPENYWVPGTAITVDVNVYGKDLATASSVSPTSTRPSPSAMRWSSRRTTRPSRSLSRATASTSSRCRPPSARTPRPRPTRLHHRRPVRVHDHGLVHLRRPLRLGAGLPHAGRVGDADVLQRHLLPLRPWSLGDQGVRNVSHGCLNLSPANAKWIFDNTKRGDIVVVRNTVGGTLPGTDGLGDWNIPWSTWKAGNAAA